MMGGTARQFNKLYTDYKKQFKKPIHAIAALMPWNFLMMILLLLLSDYIPICGKI